MRMRRTGTVLALAGAGVLVGRAFAPRLHQLERMPDDFPPKRMMRGIDEIRATTTRTLELLQERETVSHVA